MKKRADGLYQKQITIEVNGIKKQKCFYGKSPAEINKKILAYSGESEKGRLFSVVADEWWEEHQKTLAYNTLHGYVSAIECSKEFFKHKYIKDITPRHVNEYVMYLVSKGYAQKTVLTKLQIVRQVVNYAILNGELEYNCVTAVTIPKKLSKKHREPPTASDIKKIKNAGNLNFGLFAIFLLYTGCRRGEALAIQGKDIDFKKNTITISKSVYHKSDTPHIKEPKTEAGIRVIPLLEPLKAHLPKIKGNDYLFNYNGEMLRNKRFSTLWKNYCKAVGIQITPHQLRHAYATRLYELGIDEKSAQDLMGHADISTTRNIYTHISEEKRKTTAEQLKGF